MSNLLSIILPCRNESESLKTLLPQLKNSFPEAEIIVVDDASEDDSVVIAQQYAKVIQHRYNMGNGAAIKSGARQALGDILIFMDADGQHDPKDISRLLEKYHEGFDMVVGARGAESQANTARRLGNGLYNNLASWMTGQNILDLTSGFRIVNAKKFKEFLPLLPNTFSYPTTITMAFFRAGYSVGYLPIKAHQRIGKSHIKLLKDGVRFLMIIFKIGTLYAPLKLFGPLSLLFLGLGTGYYTYTFLTAGRFTNMGMLLFTTSLFIFLIGLVSEQITQLLYIQKDHDRK